MTAKHITNLRIIFMGTPEFAVASLAKLVACNCNIVAVITAPDKPSGRGMQLQASAVKQYAVAHNLPLLQPTNLKDEAFVQALSALQADVQVVVAFRMLPQVVWSMPPMGTINVHGSLLPKYRGAAPINWAIMHGDTVTGVTTFKLAHAIDTGHILMQQQMPINPTDTAGTIHDAMMHLGAAVLIDTLTALLNNTITPIPQLINDEAVVHAPKLNKDNCIIDWSHTCTHVYNHIRGLAPYPNAYTYLDGLICKVYEASMLPQHHIHASGTILTDCKTYLNIATTDGYIQILSLQLAGKKRMDTASLLRGYTIKTKAVTNKPT